MTLDWTAIIVAVIALIATFITTLKVREQAKKPDIVSQAGAVSSLAVEQMNRMANAMNAMEEEIADFRERIQALENEIIRLGGDPGLILTSKRRST